jgi:hypothetical protein
LGNDSIIVTGGTSIDVAANKGDDTLSFGSARYFTSTLDTGEGSDYIVGTGTTTGSSVLGGAGSDTFSVTNVGGKLVGGSGNDSFSLTVTSGTVFGGASAGDTAAGDDTLTLATMAAGRVDLGGGKNYSTASGAIAGGTIVSGAGNDSFTFDTTYAGRIGSGAGNDSFTFTGSSTGSGVVNLGAGNDKVTFTAAVSSASIVGGTGNDSILFNNQIANEDHIADGNEYYWQGGTDTLNFASVGTGTSIALNVNVLDTLYTSLTTEANSTAGINILGNVTSGSSTTTTTLAYILGSTSGARFTATEVTQGVIDSVTALG